MNAVVKGSCLVGMGIFVAFSGRPAHAANGALLVVVEAPPALDADAAEIRRAIGTELRSPTIAPMKSTNETSDRALIVALDHDRISISLRTNNATPIARVIPAPAERAARLRAIAWLAGNLARDQVSPIVAEAPVEMPSLATLPPAAGAPNATEPPPLAPVASPTTEQLGASDSRITVSTRAHDETPAGPPRWSIVVGDGPTTNFPLCPHDHNPTNGGWPNVCPPLSVGTGTAWRLEIQRHSGRDGFFTGAALEGTAGDFAPQLVGATAFVGSSYQLGRWGFELMAGAGLELAEFYTSIGTLTVSSATQPVVTATVGDVLRPALFADGSIGFAHPIWDSLDFVLRLGAHVSTVSYENWFLSSTIGLRYILP
jgi:hypothetical protein